MVLKISTLRPGLLVGLKTSVAGNVSYDKRVIEPEHLTEEGTQEARWETSRLVMDPVENEAAKKVRQKARALITRVCLASKGFGLLCPESLAPQLEAAITEARAMVDQFNATSTLSRVSI